MKLDLSWLAWVAVVSANPVFFNRTLPWNVWGLWFSLQDPPTHVFVPSTTGYRLMEYRCVCPGAVPYTASGTQLWTTSPAAQSVLSSYEFYLREALCGEWITEMKRLKTQLDFHSSWEVINIWICCHWELISFSSSQVLLCVPATVFVCLLFGWAVAVNMADMLLNMKNCV